MKRLFSLLAITGLCLAAPLGAQAEKIDMGALTCKQFTELDAQELTLLYFWLDGYVSHMSNDTTLDTDGVEADLQTMMEHCQAKPQSKVLDMFK